MDIMNTSLKFFNGPLNKGKKCGKILVFEDKHFGQFFRPKVKLFVMSFIRRV